MKSKSIPLLILILGVSTVTQAREIPVPENHTIGLSSVHKQTPVSEFVLKTNDPHQEINFSLPLKQVHQKNNPHETIKKILLTTPDGEEIPALFFDRNKDKVIVGGQGFPGPKEEMKWTTRLFHDYDVIIFDYRWHKMPRFIMRLSTLLHPVKTLFLQEKQEVKTVIDYLKKQKKYKEVIGLGECYSNFTFAAAQAEAEEKHETCFTKLILDSCWHNSRDWVEQISLDPWLPFSPQTGGTPTWLQSFLHKPFVHWAITRILNLITPRLSVEPYLNKVTVPLLFIHGKNDKLVPLDPVFKKVWALTKTTEKAVFITPYEHSYNWQNSWLYRKICHCFIKAQDGKSGEQLIKKVSSFITQKKEPMNSPTV